MTAVTEVAPDVFAARGTAVNFYLLRDADALTLIDSGYPADADDVEAAIRSLGRQPGDVRALLITHAHVDHIGAANRLHERYGTPTLTGATEARHARREFLEQAAPADILRNVWRPGVLPWALRISRAGATSQGPIPHAGDLTDDVARALPGSPVPVPMPGHTTGHTAYHLPAARAVVTGDGLVTGHPLLRDTGPQLLPPMFQHGDALGGLAAIAHLDADLLLPGHGEPTSIPVADAVAEARARGYSGPR